MTIQILTSSALADWKRLRLESLQKAPENFASSFEEESVFEDTYFQDQIEKNTIFGAWVEGQLAGSIGLYCLTSLKGRHQGVLWGVYLQPAYRGQGIASHLLEAVIAYARSHVLQLHLTCNTQSLSAFKLYKKHGFIVYGTEPRAIRLGDRFFDCHKMILFLKS